jgi:hypothetical protein
VSAGTPSAPGPAVTLAAPGPAVTLAAPGPAVTLAAPGPAVTLAAPGPAVTPAPTEEEAAAIVAAVEVLWPRAVVGASGAAARHRSVAWKFSGRWWARPVAARRARPWY